MSHWLTRRTAILDSFFYQLPQNSHWLLASFSIWFHRLKKGNSNKKVNKYKAKSWKQVPGSLMKEAIRSYQFSCHRQIIRHTTLTNIPVIQPHTPLTLSLAQGNIIHHFASSKISILTKFKLNLACICQLFEQYSDICETNHKWTQFYDSISSPIRQKGETVSN